MWEIRSSEIKTFRCQFERWVEEAPHSLHGPCPPHPSSAAMPEEDVIFILITAHNYLRSSCSAIFCQLIYLMANCHMKFFIPSRVQGVVLDRRHEHLREFSSGYIELIATCRLASWPLWCQGSQRRRGRWHPSCWSACSGRSCPCLAGSLPPVPVAITWWS